jgi:recombination protein RecA
MAALRRFGGSLPDPLVVTSQITTGRTKMKHIPNIVGDTPRDVAEWQKSLKALMPERGERARITVATIPTGLPTLDIALGGGLFRGRIVELFGLQGAGKSTLIYHTVMEAQRIGGVCVLVAVGSQLNLDYAQGIGVCAAELFVAHVKTDDEALRLAELLAESGLVDLVVVDSLTTVIPAHPIEATQDDSPAQMRSKTVRKLARHVDKTQTLCLISSQTREKTWVIGSPETHPGGLALKFLSAQRLHVKKLRMLPDGCTGVRVNIVRNCWAPPHRTVMLDIRPGKGVSVVGCVLDLAVKYDIVADLDSGFFYKKGRLGFVRSEVEALLEIRPDLARQIEIEISEQLALEHKARLERPFPAVPEQDRWMYLDASREDALARTLRNAVLISLPETRNRPRRQLCVTAASCHQWLLRLVP